MSRVKEFVMEIMERYADTVEGFGKYLLAGMAVLLIYSVMAVTMPVWYLPYKFFKNKSYVSVMEFERIEQETWKDQFMQRFSSVK